MKSGEKAHLNELLRYERKRRNWSREYVAEQIGAPEDRMVGRWEREGVLPHPAYRQRLCELYGRSARELGFVEPGEVPIWHVPYRRNPFFTGREAILTYLHELLSTTKTAALTQPEAISGLGGIGKTQVALEYAYRYGAEYQAVLWARAASRDVLTSDFAALATLLNLPEKDTQDQSQVVAAVKRWLASLSRWLLILDNVEDLQLLTDFLPQVVKGQVLLTTRLQTGGPLAHLIQVEVMGPEEGTLFLLRRARIMAQDAPLESASYADWTQARTITQAMGGLPLALDQAGAYVEETQCSLAEYLARYQTHGSALLRERGEMAPDHPEAVVGTFLLSLEKVGPANPAAADLLRLCAFLHPDAIPEEIFTGGAAELGPVLGPAASDSLQLDTAIKQLLRYSLLRRNRDTKTLSIHRLVQAVLRNEMDKQECEQWVERAVAALNSVFPKVVHEVWEKCERLVQHVLVCAVLVAPQMQSLELASLLDKGATYLRERAKYKESEPLYQRALHIREQALGPEHLDVASILNELALLYYRQSKYEESEPLYQRALHIREQTLGPEHPDVASTLTRMADLYYDQGKYEESEPLYQRALHIREQVLGPEHPSIPYTLNNLANLYDDQGKHEEAESLYQRALHIWEQVLGPEHPLVASPLNNLATVYQEQGKYEEAKPLYQRALHIWEQALGPEHPDVTYPLVNLADISREQGEYEESEKLYQRALRVREQALGPAHPQVAYPLNGLANLYRDQGNYEQAEAFYKRALTIRQQQRGPQHPEMAESLHDFARFYELQKQLDEALTLYQQALGIREQVLGKYHPYTVDTRIRYIRLLRACGRLDEAAKQEIAST